MKPNSSYRDLISMICTDPLGADVGAAVIQGYVEAFQSGDRDAISIVTFLWGCDMEDEREADVAITVLSRVLDASSTYAPAGKEDLAGALKILFDAAPEIFVKSPALERKARLSYATLVSGPKPPAPS